MTNTRIPNKFFITITFINQFFAFTSAFIFITVLLFFYKQLHPVYIYICKVHVILYVLLHSFWHWTKNFTAQKKKFSVQNFLGKCDQIGKNLQIWSHLMKKSVMENFIFWAVTFMFLTTSGTHNFPYRSVILLQLPMHLFVSIL